MVAICVSITVYQGYSCTEKYIGKPVTTEESLKSVAEFSDLRLSICKQLTIEECTTETSFSFASLWSSNYYYEYEEADCTFPDGVVPNYASSYDQFWADLDNRKVSYKIADLIKEMSVWNKSTNAWDVLVAGDITDDNLFRKLSSALFCIKNL